MCSSDLKDSSIHVDLDEEFKIYENHNNSIHDKKYVNYLKDFIDHSVVPFSGNGRQGFDFGSGPEPVLSMIMENDYGYEMDIHDKFYATEKVYENKKYDLITSTEVIEHLDNPLEYFKLFKDHLNNNGILALMTLFHPVDRDKILEWFYIRDKSHISFFTPKTMEIIAEKTELEFIYTNNHRYGTFKKVKI